MSTIQQQLSELYHSPEGYISKVPFKSLAKKKGVKATNKQIDDFFLTVPEDQRFKQVPPTTAFAHFEANGPNDIHQADRMRMPKDLSVLEGSASSGSAAQGYEYMLVVIDLFSRYAAVRPLKTSEAPETKQQLQDIYDNDPRLKHPHLLMTDIGTEFKGITGTYLKENNIRHMVPVRGATHNHTSIVERFNKTITGPLFRQQHTKERENMTDKQADVYTFNTEWVEKLQQFITAYNNREHHAFYFKMTPSQAFDKPEEVVYARQFVPDEPPPLEIGTIVKIPQPSHSIRQRHMRETFSNVLYVVSDILPGNPFTPTRYIIVKQDTGVAEPIPHYRQQLLVASTVKADMDEVLRVNEAPVDSVVPPTQAPAPARPKAPTPRLRLAPQALSVPVAPPKPQATRTGRAVHAPKNRWLDTPSVGGGNA